VPAASQLIEVSGSFVGDVNPENALRNEWTVKIAQKGGIQVIDGCRNAANALEEFWLGTIENENGISRRTGIEATEFTLKFPVGVNEEFMT
jgi:hypothetical protein